MINDMFELIRGDTLGFGFVLEFDGDPQYLDSAYFTCKKNLDDNAPVFQKTLGNGITVSNTDGSKVYYAVRVSPEDTNALSSGQYYYDLQIGLNGDIFTIMAGAIEIQDDVTR